MDNTSEVIAWIDNAAFYRHYKPEHVVGQYEARAIVGRYFANEAISASLEGVDWGKVSEVINED